MTDPHQFKVRFGIFLLSRRTYFLLWVLGLTIWVGIAFGYSQFLTPGTRLGDIIRREVPWIDTAGPWIFWGVIGVECVEAVFALWRFRRRETFLLRERMSVDHVGEL